MIESKFVYGLGLFWFLGLRVVGAWLLCGGGGRGLESRALEGLE